MALDRSKFYREEISPFTGQKYLIRRMAIRDFYRDIGVMPLGLPQSVTEDLKSLMDMLQSELAKRADDKEFEQSMVRYILEKGVVEPGVWFLDRDRCPENAVVFEDMGDDYHWLVQQIVEFTFNISFTRAMDKFFRDSSTGDSRLDGEEVRH